MTTLTKTDRPVSVPETARKTTYLMPPANIRETKDAYILHMEMPGVGKTGLDVTVDNNQLIITGHRSDTDIPEDAFYRESRHWDYRRVFDIDPSIDKDKINARMEQGVLTLTLSKTEAVKPKKIEITG